MLVLWKMIKDPVSVLIYVLIVVSSVTSALHSFQAGARLRGVENQFNKNCHFIDGWNLPENCELKLEQVLQENRMVLPGSDTQYRLKSAEKYETTEVCIFVYLARLFQNRQFSDAPDKSFSHFSLLGRKEESQKYITSIARICPEHNKQLQWFHLTLFPIGTGHGIT